MTVFFIRRFFIRRLRLGSRLLALARIHVAAAALLEKSGTTVVMICNQPSFDEIPPVLAFWRKSGALHG